MDATQINYGTLTNIELAQTAKEAWQRGVPVRELSPLFDELVHRIENTPDPGKQSGGGNFGKGRDTS